MHGYESTVYACMYGDQVKWACKPLQLLPLHVHAWGMTTRVVGFHFHHHHPSAKTSHRRESYIHPEAFLYEKKKEHHVTVSKALHQAGLGPTEMLPSKFPKHIRGKMQAKASWKQRYGRAAALASHFTCHHSYPHSPLTQEYFSLTFGRVAATW